MRLAKEDFKGRVAVEEWSERYRSLLRTPCYSKAATRSGREEHRDKRREPFSLALFLTINNNSLFVRQKSVNEGMGLGEI